MRVATRRLEKSRQYVKSIRCKRALLIQPQQTQSVFHRRAQRNAFGCSRCRSASAKFVFADCITSLKCAAQRRCGEMVDATDLKSVRANSSVWVRIPSSAPSEKRFLRGEIAQTGPFNQLCRFANQNARIDHISGTWFRRFRRSK